MKRRNDEGATLLLVVGFTLLVGAIMGALIPFITTSFSARTSLDKVRDRQYAADLVVEESIAHVRGLTDPGVNTCGPFNRSGVNGYNIHVDCSNQLILIRSGTGIFEQRNVRFTACEGTSTCTDATAILRAQVNFQMPTGSSVTRTYIQSWSVNK